MISLKTTKLSIIGLGYVGLPLVVEFGKKILVTGIDINQSRIDELKSGKEIHVLYDIKHVLKKQDVDGRL